MFCNFYLIGDFTIDVFVPTLPFTINYYQLCPQLISLKSYLNLLVCLQTVLATLIDLVFASAPSFVK